VANLVIEIINLHSGRWQNLHLNVGADIPERLCGSTQPNQLLFLQLGIDGGRPPRPKFVMKSKPFPTQLALTNFPPTTIDIGWEKITHAILSDLTSNECPKVLQRAPLLKYCQVQLWHHATVNPGTTILHRRLRSLNSSYSGTGFLEAINVPSLEEWTHSTEDEPLPVTAMVSLLKCSGCCLKIVNLQHVLVPLGDLSVLFQAMPSLEHLRLQFWSVKNADGIMDDFLAQIFIPLQDASCESFLPHLQFMECIAGCGTMMAPFSWNHVPQLYHHGHRRLLTLKSAAKESHISDETAVQLLKLVDEEVDLQILDTTTQAGGDFLENFRKKVSHLSSLKWK